MIMSSSFAYEILVAEYNQCIVIFLSTLLKTARNWKTKEVEWAGNPSFYDFFIGNLFLVFFQCDAVFTNIGGPIQYIVFIRGHGWLSNQLRELPLKSNAYFLWFHFFGCHVSYFIKNWLFEQAVWISVNKISRPREGLLSSDRTCHWIVGRNWSPERLYKEVLSCYIALNFIFRGGFDSMKPYELRWNFESVLDNLKTDVWNWGHKKSKCNGKCLSSLRTEWYTKNQFVWMKYQFYFLVVNRILSGGEDLMSPYGSRWNFDSEFTMLKFMVAMNDLWMNDFVLDIINKKLTLGRTFE